MNLEDFIHNNRAAFEQDCPSDNLWQRIAGQLPPSTKTANVPEPPKSVRGNPFRATYLSDNPFRQNKSGGMRWRWAASVVLLLLAGFGWLNSRYGVTSQPEVVAISPSYAKEVAQYASLIDDKRAELQQITESNPELYKQFAGDLESLETSYQSLKADLPQTPNQEVLIQAMIQNLQLQIDLLNEQLRVIQRMKQQTTQTNELPAKPA